jgi:hypothetical protein
MLRVLKIILAVSLVGQVSMAQAPNPPAAAPGPAAPPAQADISVPQRSTLSPQDMLNQGREYRSKMNEALSRVQSLSEQARKQKDIIRLNCLMDKLVQLRGNVNIADQALASMQDAIGRRDDGAGVHEYTRLTIVYQKVQVLVAEGEACVGEDLSFVGSTRVDVDITGVPAGDTTQPPLSRPDTGRVPTGVVPPVSPFR